MSGPPEEPNHPPVIPGLKPMDFEVKEDSNAYVWSITYCDVLMVLLGFFLVIFEFSESILPSSVQHIVNRIGININTKDLVTTPLTRDPVKLKNPNVRYKEGVLIHLEDNIFDVNEYRLTENAKRQLDKVFTVIQPYGDEVLITFIGHADSIPMNANGAVIDSNLILSNMRAAHAVKYALEKGFNPFLVSSKGVGEFSRDSRSVSIQIIARN